MKILELFGKYDLREKCVERYGEKFGKMYDTVCGGGSIGDMVETANFAYAVEEVISDMESKTILSRLKMRLRKYQHSRQFRKKFDCRPTRRRKQTLPSRYGFG